MAVTGTPSSGNDTVTGDGADDEIAGLEGNDILSGGGGSDDIYGDVVVGSNLEFDSGQSNNSWSQGTVVGWTNSGSGGDIERWGFGFQGLFPADGSTFIELDADGNGGRDHLQTDLDLADGVEYLLRFDHAARLGGGVNDDFQVTLNGAVIATISPSTTNTFTTSELILTGGAGAETLGFRELGSQNNSLGILLDNVQISLSQSEVDRGTQTFDDTIDGGAGNDRLYGQQGDDTITGGADDDYMEGGIGDDTFIFADGSGSDTIGDFVIGEDILDVTALTDAEGNPVDVDDVTVSSDGEGGTILSFPNGEQIRIRGIDPSEFDTDDELKDAGIPCFVAGTRIASVDGAIAVECLQEGDLLITYPDTDGPMGQAPILRLFQHKVDLVANPDPDKLRPVRIAAGALGPGYPERDLWVSRQHRMLLRSKIAGRMFGQPEVLLPAIKLVGLPGVTLDHTRTSVTYFHILMPRHEIIYAEGTPTESLFTGPEAMRALSPEAREEISTLFPELGARPTRPARPIPTQPKQKQLIRRHAKNQQPCLSGRHVQGMR